MLKKKAALALALIMVLTIACNVMAAQTMRTIRLNDNGNITIALTMSRTVGEFLEERGVTLHKKDIISHDLDRRLVDGWRIEIRRAFPIMITVDGVQREFMVPPDARLGNIVSDLKEEYGHGFYHNYSTAEVVTKNSTFYFYSVAYDTVTETRPIEFETEIKLSDNLLIGTMEVAREGALGIMEYVYDVHTVYGEAPVFTLAATSVILEPVNRVEIFGTRQPTPDEIEEIDLNAPKEFIEKFTLDSTAYSLDFNSTRKLPSHPGYGITKSGIYAVPGVVAVDPRVIPLGTILYVDGYGYAVAADIGSAIKGMKIDLFFEDVRDALTYGRKKVNVYVVEYPDSNAEQDSAV